MTRRLAGHLCRISGANHRRPVSVKGCWISPHRTKIYPIDTPFLSRADVYVVMRYFMSSTNKAAFFPLGTTLWVHVDGLYVYKLLWWCAQGCPLGMEQEPNSLSHTLYHLLASLPLFRSPLHRRAIHGRRISSLGKLARRPCLVRHGGYIQAVRRVSVQQVNLHGMRRLLHPHCQRNCGRVEVCVLLATIRVATTMVTLSLPARSRTPRSTKKPLVSLRPRGDVLRVC